jgi:nickel-dependent lactate racemase
MLEMARGAVLYFVVATGAHARPTREEIVQIFGGLWQRVASRVVIHDCRNMTEMQRVGVTSRGTSVSFNRIALDADRIVVLSSVEPHYFAGYTGGRKSLLPGLAAFETIEQNHSLALEAGVKPLALVGNPVHEDIVEALAFLGDKPVFAVNLVLDGDGRIYAATAGDLSASFIAATKRADEVYVAPIRDRADVVVSVARNPLDRDLYQIQKTLEHGLLALKQGGLMILVSKCWDGVGEDSYMEPIRRFGDPTRVLEHVLTHRRFGCHKAGRLAQAALRAKLFAVTDVDPRILRGIFLEPHSFLQQAIDNALSIAGPNSQLLFLMNGSLTVPKLEDGALNAPFE